jgi:hypothetical protein
MGEFDAYLATFAKEYLPNAQQATVSFSGWKKRYPGEYAAWVVFRDALLAGGEPPAPSMASRFGKSLVAAGEMHMSISRVVGIMKGTGEEPPPPPLPPGDEGVPYDTLSSLSRVFGKWFTELGSGGQEPLATSPPYAPWASISPNPSITEISTPHGAGLRFVCKDDMQASWDAGAKLSYAARDRTWPWIGQTEQWTFRAMFPSSGNPSGMPNAWAVNGMWEIGHTADSGHHIALDMQTGQPRFRVGRQFAGGNFYNYTYTPTIAMDVWHDFVVRCKWSQGSDGMFFCSINGQVMHNDTGATYFAGFGDPFVVQWGWYGTRVLSNEVQIARMRRVML